MAIEDLERLAVVVRPVPMHLYHLILYWPPICPIYNPFSLVHQLTHYHSLYRLRSSTFIYLICFLLSQFRFDLTLKLSRYSRVQHEHLFGFSIFVFSFLFCFVWINLRRILKWMIIKVNDAIQLLYSSRSNNSIVFHSFVASLHWLVCVTIYSQSSGTQLRERERETIN